MSGIAKAFKAMIRTVRKKITKKSEVLVILGYVEKAPTKGQSMRLYRNEMSAGRVLLLRKIYQTSEVVAIQKLDKYVWRVFTEDLKRYYIVELIHDSTQETDAKLMIGSIYDNPMQGSNMKMVRIEGTSKGYMRTDDINSDNVDKVVSLYNNKVWHIRSETGRFYIVETI